ncbi:hypothetical protein [Bacteroides gallinarum]|uniref:hypothetical protein n=1 Tax=Bacteroides gallinarum TaxID=376806 RepID=UPI0003A79BE5|nr:hypothetical protein [Bacteroides gallinarum]
MKKILFIFLGLLPYCLYAQIGTWTDQLSGGKTVGKVENMQYIFTREPQKHKGMISTLGDDPKIAASSPNFFISSRGKFTFGGEITSPCIFNFKQGSEVYAALALYGERFYFYADRTINFKARGLASNALSIDNNNTYLTNSLRISPINGAEIGKLDFTVGPDNNFLIYNSYDSWFRVASKGGIAFWGNLNYKDTNPTLLIKDSYVKIGGNVPIGPESIQDYSLFVKKGILAEDVGIGPNNYWADFVFYDNYKLLPLTEVEKYIKKYKHLPCVPSKKEVAEKGYSQHEMNVILLQKIEEITLHVIDHQKRIDDIKDNCK